MQSTSDHGICDALFSLENQTLHDGTLIKYGVHGIEAPGAELWHITSCLLVRALHSQSCTAIIHAHHQ